MANRLALITGGTKGLGKAVAERLLAEGFDACLTYANDDERADAVRQDLAVRYPESKVFTVRADAADMASVSVLIDFVEGHGTPLDTLVLNAGLTDRSDLESLDLEAWRRVFEANVHVPVFTIQRLLNYFSADASIVFTGSLMAIHPHSMSLAYGASKSTVHAVVKNLVKFLSPRGIRVNAVAPGFVDTEWQLAKPAEIRASINSKIALERFATPDQIADIYLALIRNPYVNGEIVKVDGGYSYR